MRSERSLESRQAFLLITMASLVRRQLGHFALAARASRAPCGLPAGRVVFAAVRGYATDAPATPAAPAASKSTTTASTPLTFPGEATENYQGDGSPSDWSRSFAGLGSQAFSPEAAAILQAPLDPMDVEMKPGVCPSVMKNPLRLNPMSQTVSFTCLKSSIVAS